MPEPERPRLYGILTVRLSRADAPANNAEAYKQLKSKLGLENPVIDDAYGAQPADEVHPHMARSLPKNSYFVLVDYAEIRRLMETGHPNVVGLHHAAAVPSGKGPMPMSLDDIEKLRKAMQQNARPPQPTRKPPRKKPGGPKFF
jgi:hypothetical protein